MPMLALFHAKTCKEPSFDGGEIVLHELEGHGRENETEEKIERTEERFATLVIRQCTCAGHEIAQTNGREGNEGEISTVDKRPSFPARKEKSTGHDVEREESERRDNGHVFDRFLFDLEGERMKDVLVAFVVMYPPRAARLVVVVEAFGVENSSPWNSI